MTPPPKYVITITEGVRPQIFEEVARAISELGGIYRKADSGKLVFAALDMWVTITPAWLRLYLARNIYFSKGGLPADPPAWLVATVLAMSYELKISTADTSKPPSAQIEERPR